jgi:thiol-disulfide isomerase/thioredoxin
VRLARGAKLPPVPLRAIDGRLRPLSEVAEPGRTTIVNFWATWCEACKEEMPELSRLHARDTKVRVVGVSVDEDTPAMRLFLPNFARMVGARYPIYVAGKEVFDRVFSDGGVAVPLSLVLDGEGRVSEVLTGWSRRTQQRFLALAEGAAQEPR